MFERGHIEIVPTNITVLTPHPWRTNTHKESCPSHVSYCECGETVLGGNRNIESSRGTASYSRKCLND